MKTRLTKSELDKIIELFNQDIGSRKIANIIGVNRSTIQAAYKQLSLNSTSKKTPRFAFKQKEKCCKICNTIKYVNNFRERLNDKTGRISFETYCKDCESFYLKEMAKKRSKILRQNNPNFVLRRSISYFVWKNLKKNNSSKNKESCLKYLPYSIQELRQYLESKFEPWMTWENHGNYNSKTWDDNDVSTWTWQIDHIIPQSDLQYTSMQDNNFKICWALKNLRPLSSKQNNKDGVNKIRHKSI